MANPTKTDNSTNNISLTGLVGEFAKNTHIDPQGDIEFSLLKDLVNAFATNPVMARRAMRELLSRSPSKFFSSALQILKMGVIGVGADYMIGLLLENDMLLIALADPRAFGVETAVALARHLHRLDSHLDAKLLKQVLREGRTASEDDLDSLERILHIVDAISDGTRLVAILMKLLRHPDPRICSKAALILVRSHRNADWLSQQLNTPDARVRANAVEGLLYTRPTEKELQVVWGATSDPHHRVCSTALLVLAKNGHAKAVEELVRLMAHHTELVRAGAAWALGQYGDPQYLALLQQTARNDSGAARRMAIKSSAILRRIAAEQPHPAPEVDTPQSPELEPAETGAVGTL